MSTSLRQLGRCPELSPKGLDNNISCAFHEAARSGNHILQAWETMRMKYSSFGMSAPTCL